MGRSIETPLGELDTICLYELLGDAWLGRFGEAWFEGSKGVNGDAHFLQTPAEVGKREFDALLPVLRQDLLRPGWFGFVDGIDMTIQRSGTWRMPTVLVAALAVQHGLERANVIQFPKRPRSLLAE